MAVDVENHPKKMFEKNGGVFWGVLASEKIHLRWKEMYKNGFLNRKCWTLLGHSFGGGKPKHLGGIFWKGEMPALRGISPATLVAMLEKFPHLPRRDLICWGLFIIVIEVLEQISGAVANIPLSNPGCLDNIYSRYRRNSGTIKSIAI